MGSDVGQFWWRALTFSWFGHQSRFEVPWGLLWVTPVTGHVPSRSSFIAPATASGLSDMGILPGSNGGVQELRAVEQVGHLSLIHISEPTRLGMISYAVFCLKK